MAKAISDAELRETWTIGKLLSTQNTKTLKGEKFGYRTYILHLAPSNLSGKNTCAGASNGCAAACLNTSGLGCTQSVQTARINRTKFFHGDQEAFMLKLADEIQRGIKSARNAGKIPAFRLNGTSDIVWEKIRFGPENQTIFEMFPDVEFYDYTKIAGRKAKPDENYSLTFSRSENNEKAVAKAMNRGQNVAVVFGEELPETWRGPNGESWDVLDGDESDLRFLDPPRSVVGLKAKGQGRQDTTGFVLYGDGVLDTSRLEDYRKKAIRDPSILGQRKIDGEACVPIHSKLTEKAAQRTAEILRQSGRKARVVSHKPVIGGIKKEAFAVYTPGAFARASDGSRVALVKRASRRPLRTRFRTYPGANPRLGIRSR